MMCHLSGGLYQKADGGISAALQYFSYKGVHTHFTLIKNCSSCDLDIALGHIATSFHFIVQS